MEKQRIQAKRRIVIPDNEMEEHNLEIGDGVVVSSVDKGILVIPENDAEEELFDG